MNCSMRILVVLDEASVQDRERVVTYAAGLLGGRKGIEVHLLLVLPPTPVEFLEFGSLEAMDRQAIAKAAHKGTQAQWLDARWTGPGNLWKKPVFSPIRSTSTTNHRLRAATSPSMHSIWPMRAGATPSP